MDGLPFRLVVASDTSIITAEGHHRQSAAGSVLIALPVVGQFTIGPIRTPQELDLACRFLLQIFPSMQARWRGPGLYRDRLASQSPMMLTARQNGQITGVVLGHVDDGGLGTVDHLAVAAAMRSRGLGRRLLSALELGARNLGVRQLTLGSIDGAVGFYSDAATRDACCSSSPRPRAATRSPRSLPDFALLETQWQDIPQLWVQTPRIDFTLTGRVKDRDGVCAQWVMDKDLNPPAADTRRS
jgi:GNAT superfamily N-acetyltransferase